MLWKTKAPTKVAGFGWTVAWNRCLTQDMLQRRGFALCSRCFFCEESLESVNHLFLHCRQTRQIWDLFLNIYGVKWAIPNSVRSLLESWQGQSVGKRNKKMWMTIPLCIMWTIWLERNKRCFEDQRTQIRTLKNNCLQNLYFWCTERVVGDLVQLLDFMEL